MTSERIPNFGVVIEEAWPDMLEAADDIADELCRRHGITPRGDEDLVLRAGITAGAIAALRVLNRKGLLVR